MGRRLVIIAVLLLGGALVNVAVAWGCDLLPPPRVQVEPDSAGKFDWPGVVPDDWPRWADFAEEGATLGRTEIVAGTVDGRRYLVYQTGLPTRSMAHCGLFVASTRHVSIRGQWDSFLGRVNVDPIWPGFAVNTIFYAVLLWLAFRGLLAVRHLLRRRRGLCPKCGYPMGESGSCTECGAALPARAAT